MPMLHEGIHDRHPTSGAAAQGCIADTSVGLGLTADITRGDLSIVSNVGPHTLAVL